MGNYGGIQLPSITEGKMDSEKERRQILNYLALLDEKLRYMFQNIDIEENLSEDAKALFFQYGEDIQNVIKDSEGNFSMRRQTLNEISTIVADNRGTYPWCSRRRTDWRQESATQRAIFPLWSRRQTKSNGL